MREVYRGYKMHGIVIAKQTIDFHIFYLPSGHNILLTMKNKLNLLQNSQFSMILYNNLPRNYLFFLCNVLLHNMQQVTSV